MHILTSTVQRAPRATTLARAFSRTSLLASHSNPLGLPTNKPQPPTMPRKGGPVRKSKIPGVKSVIVVASGKGGVGKSTVSANLALSLLLQKPNKRIGLLDLDVFGPSVPRLMGLEGFGEPELTAGGRLIPLQNHGISTMSMGYLVPHSPTGENPIVWRGIMVMKAVQQLLFDTEWTANAASSASTSKGEELDILVIDMPPGTGDVALSLGQLVLVDGAIIVSTPQDVALIDARKGVGMFKKLNIPILGLLLNMSSIPATPSSPALFPFGSPDKFHRAARELDAPVLGDLPIASGVSEGGDSGRPVVISGEGGESEETIRKVMKGVAEGVWEKLER